MVPSRGARGLLELVLLLNELLGARLEVKVVVLDQSFLVQVGVQGVSDN